MRCVCLALVGLLLSASNATGHIDRDRSIGTWKVSGRLTNGRSYTGTVRITKSASRSLRIERVIDSIGGKSVTRHTWSAIATPRGSSNRLRFRFRWHERGGRSANSSFLYSWSKDRWSGSLAYSHWSGKGNETWTRVPNPPAVAANPNPAPSPPLALTPPPAPIPPAGPNGDPLFGKLVAGTHTKAEAAQWLEQNWKTSQAYIKKNIRSRVHPNFTRGHRNPMAGMVVHYTAGQSMDATLRYFTMNQSRKASSHFLVDLDGEIIQVFHHANRTWHAGSKYNHTHFGFDYVNCGYLKKSGSKYLTYNSREYKLSTPFFGRKPMDFGRKVMRRQYWMPTTHAQLISHIVVGRALAAVYPLQAAKIETHGSVSTNRVDPGPTVPMRLVIAEIFSTSDLRRVQWLKDFRNDPKAFLKNYWAGRT